MSGVQGLTPATLTRDFCLITYSKIMEQLIPIHKQEDGSEVASARDLHAFLGSKRDFSNWITQRIAKFGFIENQDYTSFNKIVERENGATTRVEYAITLDMAKELSMVEGNEKGKKARLYFIAKEKEAKILEKKLPQLPDFNDPVASARAWADEVERKAIAEAKVLELAEQNSTLKFQTEIQEKELKVSAPKVEYFDKVLDSINTYATTQIAKELGMSAIALNQKLKERGVQYQVNGQWVLTHKFQDRGYVKTKTFSYTTSTGNNGSNIQTVWTEKGRKYIHEIMNTQLNIYENNDQARLPVRSL